MGEDILTTCATIISEAQAITEYTNAMAATHSDVTRSVYQEIRDDELSHIHKLVIALTEMIQGSDGVATSGEPTQAAAMTDS